MTEHSEAGPVRVLRLANAGEEGRWFHTRTESVVVLDRIDPPLPGGVGPGDTLKWWHGVGPGTDPVAYELGLTIDEVPRKDFGVDDWYLDEGGERVYLNRV